MYVDVTMIAFNNRLYNSEISILLPGVLKSQPVFKFSTSYTIMTQSQVSERAQQLLKLLIDRYIREGQPVGSKALAQELQLSSATVRSVMADLEEQGILSSPHKSAGRIPTALGYRFYVDTLVSVQPLQAQEVQKAQAELEHPDTDVSMVIDSASSVLSNFTQMAGLVSLPKREQSVLQQIEFVSLSDNKVLSILVFNDNDVQNRIIYTDRSYSKDELQQAANFLNSQFANLDLSVIRHNLLESMQTDRKQMDDLMCSALAMADKALENEAHDAYVVKGQSNLFDLAKSAGIDKLRSLFEMFSEKQQILHLLDRCIESDGVQIFIGEESGHTVFEECSVVSAPYSVDGKVIGVLGVIGPTRMPYDRVIPVVDITARILGQALSSESKK